MRTALRLPAILALLTMSAVLTVTGLSGTALAQNPPRSPIPYLDSLIYDEALRGPLIVVAPPHEIPAGSSLSADRVTLPEIADAMKMRLVRAGGVNVLVRRSSVTINTNPGKPDRLAGDSSASDHIKLLFLPLTEEQWKRLGSRAGLGLADLDPDQRRLWSGAIPPVATLMTLGGPPSSDPPDSPRYTVLKDTSRVRLRMVRQVTVQLEAVSDDSATAFPAFPYMDAEKPGDKPVYLLNPGVIGQPTEEGAAVAGQQQDEPESYGSAYGADLLVRVPNRLKAGQLDFKAVALDKTIDLHWLVKPLPKIGDIMARIAAATNLDLRYDARLRTLPCWIRGGRARSGDILLALAQGVGGAFRKIEPVKRDDRPIWLLTADIDGIGSRIGHLREWLEDAELAKSRLFDRAMEQAHRERATAPVGFEPGDPFNPGKPVTDRIEAAYRAGRDDPEFRTAGLPQSLRDCIRDNIREKASRDEPVTLRADRVRLGETFSLQFLLPQTGEAAIGSGNMLRLEDSLMAEILRKGTPPGFGFGSRGDALSHAEETPNVTPGYSLFLARIYQAARRVQPHLPILIDERGVGANPYSLQYVARWDSREEPPPAIGDFEETPTPGALRQTTKQAFFVFTPDENSAGKPFTPPRFANAIAKAASASAADTGWNGLAVDMTAISGTDLLRLLAGLPMSAYAK